MLLTLQANLSRDELKAGVIPEKLKIIEKKDSDKKTEDIMFETAVELLDRISENL